MHHFGGGYTDLKVDSRTVYGLGYQEIGPDGGAPCATQRIKN